MNTSRVAQGKVCLIVDGSALPVQNMTLYSELLKNIPLDFEIWSVQEQAVLSLPFNCRTFADMTALERSLSELVDCTIVHLRLSESRNQIVAERLHSVAPGAVIIGDFSSSPMSFQVSPEHFDQVVLATQQQQHQFLARGGNFASALSIAPQIEKIAAVSPHDRLSLKRGKGLPEGLLIFSNAQIGVNLNRQDTTLLSGNPAAAGWEGYRFVDFPHPHNLTGLIRAVDALVFFKGELTNTELLREALAWNVTVFSEFSLKIPYPSEVVRGFGSKEELSDLLQAYASSPEYRKNLQDSQREWIEKQQPENDFIEIYESALETHRQKLADKQAITVSRDATHQDTSGTFEISSSGGLKVLLQNRSNADQCPGGDTEVMKRFAETLKGRGVEVTIDHAQDVDYKKYDIVHLFNFAVPKLLEAYGRSAKAADVPFVVTTLNEDLPRFYAQGQIMAQCLVEYAQSGQNSAAFKWNSDLETRVQPVESFDNSWVASEASFLLSCGPSETESLKRQYPEANIRELQFGFRRGMKGDPEYVASTVGVRDYVLCVGRLEFRKNQLGLLKALEDSELPVILAAGGFSYFPDYADAVLNFKRRGRTIILDRLSDEDLAHLYAGARVHCLPSWYELPGLVSLEAAYQGCEVVATRYGAASDYLGDSAHYCDPGNIRSIRVAVEQAYQNSRCSELQQRIKKFTWENAADRLMLIYQEAIAQKVRSGGLYIGTITPHQNSDDFYAALKAGENAAKQRQYATAIEKLKKAISFNESSGRALRALGAVYLAQEKYSEACRSMEEAVAVDPADPRSLSGLGMAYLGLNQIERAHEKFVESIEKAPFQVVTLFQLVQTSQRLGSYDKLIDALKVYCEENADDVDMQYCLAGALYKAERYGEARIENEKVLGSQANHNGALELAKGLAELGAEATQAEPVNSESHEKKPEVEFDDNDLKLAQVQDSKGRGEFERALRELAKLRISPLKPHQEMQAEVLTGECTMLSGKLEEGKQLIAHAFQKYPSEPRVLCAQGAVLSFEGRWEEAKTLFERALMRDPRSDMAKAGLGGYLQQQGSLDEAWDRYSEALDINPESKRALLGCIQLGFELRRLEALQPRLEKYLELHPASVDFLFSLAGCLYAQDRYEEALQHLDKIRIFAPDHKDMLELRSIVEGKLKDMYGEDKRYPDAGGIKLSF